MICSKCGNQLPDDAAFCNRCGAPVTGDTMSGENDMNFNSAFVPEVQNNNDDEHVSIGMWIGIFLINLIPCVGVLAYIVMMFVWAFGSSKKKSLKNFAKAQLIILLAGVCIAIVVLLFFSILSIGSPGDVFRRRFYYYNY